MPGNLTTGIEDKAVDVKRPLWQYFWIAVTIALSVLGAILFIVLLLAVGRKRKLRAGAGILISNLLVSELLLTAIFFPLSSIAIYYSLTDSENDFFVNDLALNLVRVIIIYTFHWNSLFLAVNRYCAVLHPRFYQRQFASRRLLFGLVILSWIIGLAITMPTYLKAVSDDSRFWFEDDGSSISNNSTRSKAARKSLTFMRNTVGAYIPAVLIGTLYITVFCRITVFYKGKKQSGATSLSCSVSPPTESVVRQRRLVVAKMLFVSYWFLTLCFMTTPITYSFFPLTFLRPEVQTWTRTLDVLGHTSNPVSTEQFDRVV
ncbi:hypothetical protein RvY_10482 [Ramazzottius varieornatus]|uniref:G-protein coupled receptors family 1 profile domain-containing protein n=1 Tax=Ramazzottius varieornatus TaxID=947166 RepID=A0A1D1VCW6_RAMVA|nr:hypothetical protein RvY_10482 [Ramazzottius varieornatus]